jgi:multisubunit Na+/H+ antiporter MnhF subunit
MKAVIWLLRFAIPLVVLYSIGYFVAGFSALSFYWLFWLAILIAGGNWLIFRVFKERQTSGRKFVLNFLVATVVIFMVTLFIKGGSVPLGGSILAALIISLLQTLVPASNVLRR